MESIESINNSLLEDSTTKDTTKDKYYNLYLEVLTAEIIYLFVLGLITVTGLVGNILTVAVILRYKGIKSNTDIMVLTLAVTDILLIVFGVPKLILDYDLMIRSDERVMHGLIQYVTQTCSFVSVYVLVLISLDRYLALVHPIRTLPFRAKRNCYILIIIIWSIVLLGNIPIPLRSFSQEKVSSIQIFFICIFVFEFMLPLLLMCILYGHILKSFHNAYNPGVNTTTSRVRLMASRRVTKMVIIAMIVFIICRLPHPIMFLYIVYGTFLKISPFVFIIFYMVVECVLYLNCCINPIVFGFHSKAFRIGFRDVLSCKT